jgi:hypothetical protein
MDVEVYSTSRLGARITPADAASSGTYDIGVLANKNPSNFPDADVIVSGKFWPLNQTTGPTAGAVKQQESITVAGGITTSGNATCTVTAAGMTGSPLTFTFAVLTGTQQVETLTVLGTVTLTGNATVVVTAADLSGSPITLSVPVVNADTASDVAGKVRTALNANATIAAFFTISGAGANVVLTKVNKADNDATLNISIANGTCTGLTAVPTSTNTTGGVRSDNSADIAAKLYGALALEANITAFFSIYQPSSTVVMLESLAAAANDATMNISLSNSTCVGITPVTTSANTRAGAAANPFAANLLEIILDGTTTQATHPHSYWYCYHGWNKTGFDPDGEVVTQRQPMALGLYNASPYTLTWGIDATNFCNAVATDGTPYNCATYIQLQPGAVMAIDGAPASYYYYSPYYGAAPTAYYASRSGIAYLMNYLHVQCTADFPSYDYTGYLEVVLVGQPLV